MFLLENFVLGLEIRQNTEGGMLTKCQFIFFTENIKQLLSYNLMTYILNAKMIFLSDLLLLRILFLNMDVNIYINAKQNKILNNIFLTKSRIQKMSIEKVKIDENFCFQIQKLHTIALTNSALKLYAEKLEPEAIMLTGNLPIVLDTNVLLGYYGMANKEKQKLLKFFEENKKRIFLTQHIEKEFLKNRISVIFDKFLQPLNNIVV